MSNLLVSWLNDELKLCRKVTNLEKDFANGWLLADLLGKIGLPVEGVKDTKDPRVVVKNFSKVATILHRLRIKMTPATAQEIMTETAGAALRVIYQIRMETSRRRTVSDAHQGERLEARKRLAKASVTSNMEKLYGRKEKYEKMQKKFFETQLTHTIHEQTKNQRMEQHLKKFQDFKTRSERQQERLAEAMFKLEQKEKAEQRAQRLETMKRKQLFDKEWESKGAERWRENMRIAKVRQQGELGFELTMKEKRLRAKGANRLRNTMEVRSCIDDFERNLNRIGVQDDGADNNKNQVDDGDEDEEQTPMEEVDSLLEVKERMRRSLPDPRSLEIKATQDMKDLRRRKEADRLARKERTKRRRKVLAEQQASSESTDVDELKNTMLESLLLECKRKREVSHEFWRMTQMKEIMKENARFRSRQLAEAVERERMEKLQEGKVAYKVAREKQEHKTQVLLAQYHEIAKAKAAAQTKSNMSYARQLANKVVELALKACAYRELAGAEMEASGKKKKKKKKSNEVPLIPKQMWREWITLFVKFKPMIAPADAVGSDADTLLGIQPAEGALSMDELKDALAINNRINQSASMISSGNDTVVVDAELKRYLNGEGKWRPSQLSEDALKQALEGEAEAKKEAKKGKKKGKEEEKPGVDVKKLLTEVQNVPADFTDVRSGAVLAKIANIVHSTLKRENSFPVVPKLPLTICLLGKPYVGKKTQAEKLLERYGVLPISLRKLIEDAVAAVPSDEAKRTELEKMKPSSPAEEEAKVVFDLGMKIKQTLESGEAVNDETSVDLVLAAINRLKRKVDEEKKAAGEEAKEGEEELQGISTSKERKIGGWCLIGFPETQAQASMFEKKLSGFDIEDQKGPSKSKITPPPEQEARDLETNPYPSAIDIVFRLDAPHSTLLSRAMGQLVDRETGKVYHTLSRPPPDNAEICARLVAPEDHDQAVTELSTQIVAYDQCAGDLEAWFKQFANLRILDVGSTEQPLGQSSEFVANALSEEIQRLMKRRAEEAEKAKQNQANDENSAQKEEEKKRADLEFETARKKVEAKSGTSVAAEASKEEAKQTASDAANEGEKPPSTQGEIDAASVKKINLYTLEVKNATMLSKAWNDIETRFKTRFFSVFKSLQNQRIVQVKHYAKTRENFREFLARPANDKTFRIEDFQTDFNCIHMDLRGDPSAKAELHQRVDELADDLWEMTKKRQTQAKEEINAIISQGWAEKQAHLLIVNCSMLMSIEMERYKGTVRIIKDFFRIVLGEMTKEEEADEEGEILSVLADNSFVPNPEAEEKELKGKKTKTKKGKQSGAEEEKDEVEILKAELKYDYLVPLKQSLTEALEVLLPKDHPSFVFVKPEEAEAKKKAKKGKKKDEEEENQSAAMLQLKTHVENAKRTAQELLQEVVEAQNLQLAQRVQRIFNFCVSLIEDIKSLLFEQEYPSLTRDIARRIKGESDAIDSLCDVIRKSIERGLPIYHRLMLQGENLYVDQKHVVKLIPELPKSSVFDALSDAAYRGRFSVKQLLGLTSHLRLDFPNGFLSLDKGVEILTGMAKTAYAANPEEGLPQEWYSYTDEKFAEFLQIFAPPGILTAIDWREVIVRLSIGVNVMPPPKAHVQALRKIFLNKDADKTGSVERAQFIDSLLRSPLMDKLCGTKRSYIEALSNLWFHVFKDTATNKVDYELLLLYLCFDSAEGSGIDKALAAVGVSGEEKATAAAVEKVFKRGAPESEGAETYTSLYQAKVKEVIDSSNLDRDSILQVCKKFGGSFGDKSLFTLKDISRYQK